MKQEQFCNLTCELANDIPKLLIERVFGNFLEEEISRRYDDMRNNFDCNYEEWQGRFTTKGKPYKGFDDTTSICILSEMTKFPDLKKYNRIGMDLPTWSNINSNKPTVMFIAQDPLRSKYYEDCHDIIISSPFGIQDATHRKSRHGIVYYSIFSEIVKNGFGIYLTDARKFYLRGDKYITFNETHIEFYNQVLKEEIDLVNPKLIVTFGKDAYNSLISLNYKNEILPLIHPSGASRGHIKKRYEMTNCSNEKIVQKYIELILNRIDGY